MQSQLVQEVPELDSEIKAKGDTIAFRQLFESILKTLSATEGFVVTTLPRGSLQIAQPPRLPETLLRAYSRDFHVEDRLTWQAILRGQAIKAADAFKDFNNNRYVVEFMRANGLQFAAAAPLQRPVLSGYPGAVHVYRTTEQGAFTEADLRKLHEVARQLDSALEKVHGARTDNDGERIALTPRPQSSIFAFDEKATEIFAPDDFKTIDGRIRDQLIEHVKRRFTGSNGRFADADRLQLPDSRGDLWTFRIISYDRYPALGEGRFVFVCLQPSCADWAAVKPTDFQADPELSRLIPALKFMQQEFHRGPTLGTIAKQVHLSPFHFHRRFAELLGLTPKHYLLECQVTAAKSQLLSRRKELAEIAADCGFAHQSHFTSRFKQATGLTPTRWRRMATEAQQG